MPESVTNRVAAARGFLAKLWKLSAPYWWAEDKSEVRFLGFSVLVREKWIARGLLALIIGLAVFIVYMSKLLNDWNARFYNALQEKDSGGVLGRALLLGLAGRDLDRGRRLPAVAAAAAHHPLAALAHRELLRRLARPTAPTTGWSWPATVPTIPSSGSSRTVNLFTQQTLIILLGLLSEVMTLVTFTVVLWQLSGSYVLPIFGGVQIPGYMMWVAIIYSAIGSWLTYKIGRPLVQVNFDLERYNADFRYRMTRVRENAESIALYKGEQDEGAASWRLRAHLRHLVALHGLQQAADLAHRLLWPGGQHLPDPGGKPALLRGRGAAGRADPDRQRLRLRPGLALLVRRCLAHARRLESHHRPADHLRRGHGGAEREATRAPSRPHRRARQRARRSSSGTSRCAAERPHPARGCRSRGPRRASGS